MEEIQANRGPAMLCTASRQRHARGGVADYCAGLKWL